MRRRFRRGARQASSADREPGSISDWLTTGLLQAHDGQASLMDLYIYYRARAVDAQRLQTAVGVMQDALRSACHVRCGLKRRPQAVEDRHTWMEVYLSAPADFEILLDAALTRTDLPSLIDGSRHNEYFLDSLPCA